MKFFKWLGNAGRVSAVALLGAGGVAVVGVLGTAAYLLNGPDGNTSFSDLGYTDPDQVVFTTGSNVKYEKGDGTNPLISSRNIKITDEKEENLRRGEELAARQREMQQYATAYGTSQGDGLVGNPTYAGGEEINQLTGMMNNIQELTASVAAGAAGGVPPEGKGNGEGEGSGGGISPLTRASTKWTNGVNGSGGVNPYGGAGSNGIQNEWSGSAGGSGGNANQVGDIIANAQQEAQSKLEEMRLKGAQPPRPHSHFGQDHNTVGPPSKLLERRAAEDRITFAQKRSADEARNKHRLPVTTAFLDGTRVPGGVTLLDGAETFDTGGTQETQDLDPVFKKGLLNNAGGYLDSLQKKSRDREHDGNILRKAMWICFGIALAMSILIPLLKSIPFFGVALSFVALCVGLAAVAVLGGYIVHFLQQGWSYRGIPITATVFAGTMTLGLILSFVLGGGSVTVKEGAVHALGKGLGLSVAQTAAIGGGLCCHGYW